MDLKAKLSVGEDSALSDYRGGLNNSPIRQRNWALFCVSSLMEMDELSFRFIECDRIIVSPLLNLGVSKPF